VSKSTAIRAVDRVTNAPLVGVAERYIRWPEGARVQEVVDGFARRRRFPGVIGAVDGTHITIPAPTEDPRAYISRKKRYAIHLQVRVSAIDFLLLGPVTTGIIRKKITYCGIFLKNNCPYCF